MNFLSNIKQRAKANVKTIVLPESGDIRTLKAAGAVISEKLANIILVGDKDAIISKAADIDLSNVTFINPSNYERLDEFVIKLYELRKNKGLTMDDARKLLLDNPLYMGVMLVKEGVADGMVAGAVNSTPNVLRPGLQILKTAPGTKLVSAFFVMDVPNCEYGADGTFVFSDSGLNQNPTSDELAYIALSSAESFEHLVGKDAVVAMLSHSTKGSAKHADVDKVVAATKLARQLAPNLKLDGELQLDAAIVPEIGSSKAPGSDVAGKANVLIFPDLDSGNIGYKIVERLAKAQAYGPITQGIAKPVNDLSRGCSAEDIIGVIAITSVQSDANKKFEV